MWLEIWEKSFGNMWEDKDGGGLLFLLITVSVLLDSELAMLSGATLDVSRRHN